MHVDATSAYFRSRHLDPVRLVTQLEQWPSTAPCSAAGIVCPAICDLLAAVWLVPETPQAQHQTYPFPYRVRMMFLGRSNLPCSGISRKVLTRMQHLNVFQYILPIALRTSVAAFSVCLIGIFEHVWSVQVQLNAFSEQLMAPRSVEPNKNLPFQYLPTRKHIKQSHNFFQRFDFWH